jgi:hypothetical protein
MFLKKYLTTASKKSPTLIGTFEHTTLFRNKLYKFDQNFVQLHYTSQCVLYCTEQISSNVVYDCMNHSL